MLKQVQTKSKQKLWACVCVCVCVCVRARVRGCIGLVSLCSTSKDNELWYKGKWKLFHWEQSLILYQINGFHITNNIIKIYLLFFQDIPNPFEDIAQVLGEQTAGQPLFHFIVPCNGLIQALLKQNSPCYSVHIAITLYAGNWLVCGVLPGSGIISLGTPILI